MPPKPKPQQITGQDSIDSEEMFGLGDFSSEALPTTQPLYEWFTEIIAVKDVSTRLPAMEDNGWTVFNVEICLGGGLLDKGSKVHSMSILYRRPRP
jgi:hypothetical protein